MLDSGGGLAEVHQFQQHLNALHASVEQASCLSARHDWERTATAHAELCTMLGDLTGDCDLARLVSSAAGRLQDLRSGRINRTS